MLKSAYMSVAMPAGLFLRLCLRNFFNLAPWYLPRMLFVLQSSVWTSVLNIREKRRFATALAQAPLPSAPVFIVGHWRTGTTFLHQLFHADPQFATASLYETCYPGSFLSARPFVAPIMKKMVSHTRAMDNVRVGMDEPQEDEYALYRMGAPSPLQELCFTKYTQYFLLNNRIMDLSQKQQKLWKEKFHEFARKLYYLHKKPLVFKNPFHSFRIPLLRELFPDARFIHITRDPYAVVASTRHLWKVVGKQNTFSWKWHVPTFADITRGWLKIEKRIAADLSSVKEANKTFIHYEQLSAEPRKSYERICADLNIDLPENSSRKIEEFLDSLGAYRKNSFRLTSQQRKIIETILQNES